jgi:hypothetical protein
MITRAGSPEHGFDRLFDGEDQCFIFFLIQSSPPFGAVPGIYNSFGSFGRNL